MIRATPTRSIPYLRRSLGTESKFTRDQLELGVGFRCTGILGILVLKVSGLNYWEEESRGIQLGESSPAPEAFFKPGPIGFVYILQRGFRYYLNEFDWKESIGGGEDAPRKLLGSGMGVPRDVPMNRANRTLYI